MDLPPDYGFSSTFNVADLAAYKEPTTILSDPFEPSPPLESDPTPERPPGQRVWHEHIEQILDEQVITTRSNEYQYFLVCWKDRPPTEDSWITRAEL